MEMSFRKAAEQKLEKQKEHAQREDRVRQLRNKLTEYGIDTFLVPHTDEYMSDHVPPSEKRLQWLTGFSGSAGLALISQDQAVLFVDGRYDVQAREQVNPTVFNVVRASAQLSGAWLSRNLLSKRRVGFDPRLHSIYETDRLRSICEENACHLIPCHANPIDAIWHDRPLLPIKSIELHPLFYSGRLEKEKVSQLVDHLQHSRVDALVVTQPENTAWLLNIRGSDIAHIPIPFCYSIISQTNGLELFIDGQKVQQPVRKKLQKIATLHEISLLQKRLHELRDKKITIRLDPHGTNDWFRRQLEGGRAALQYATDPITGMKAQKNDVEISGARSAHIRDGVAMVKFLAWWETYAPRGEMTEIDAAKKLENFRIETGMLRDVSFETIAAAGPHAALPHYHPDQSSNRKIGKNEIFLIDSGAQYPDGTTDITRTLINGHPTDEIRDRFTRCLRGHIAVASACFPKGTSGAQIDAFARRPLWEIGLDFNHGTGHGVGSFLSVHEEPVRLSKNASMAIIPNSILSNEPGYYKPGAYGIRIENLFLVRHAISTVGTIGREDGLCAFLQFEVLSLAPIDRKLIAVESLSMQEIQWLNGYHATVWNKLEKQLEPAVRSWLRKATAPLDREEK